MTHQTQPPPNPDWSKLNLSQEYTDYLAHLHDEQTKYRMSAVLGMAIIGYVQRCGASEKEFEYLELAWYNLIVLDALG